jgi:hypothetical protein
MAKFFIAVLLLLVPWNCTLYFLVSDFVLRGSMAAFIAIPTVAAGCLAYVRNPSVGSWAWGATWLLAIDAIVFQLGAAWILADDYFQIVQKHATQLFTEAYGWGCLGVLVVTGLIALAGLGPLAVLTCVIDRWRRPIAIAESVIDRQSAGPSK